MKKVLLIWGHIIGMLLLSYLIIYLFVPSFKSFTLIRVLIAILLFPYIAGSIIYFKFGKGKHLKENKHSIGVGKHEVKGKDKD